ncbi:methyltransferase [Caulobacter sp. SLTY]|uniref:class I SAM-dependent methyltransferase n=1 Tax=Caulobacter sp. SLTY TaxID=2683262 RepID=UPI001412FA08|nr:50S ribosomal protein L11 methyltransferase [Caulobacter sp. SLTY]NBB14921.1 methyltransferase [Caulobacter sp. SLTY]
MDSDIEAFIRERLPVSEVAGCPGVRLHLAGPASGLRALGERYPAMGSPYWAHLWGGGLALSRYLAERPGTVAGRRVLDLGTGSGLVAIVAALSGASAVTAVDVDPFAVVAARLNAGLAGVSLEARAGDLLDREAPEADLVLVGDLFYEAALADRVLPFLARCRAARTEVLIGDPWRRTLPSGRLVRLADYEVVDFGSGRGPAAVFRLEG